MLSQDQLTQILTALPDPAFVLTRSGRYVAIYGGTDSRYYHDGSSLIGKSIVDVIKEVKARWFLGEIAHVLAVGGLHIVEYELSGKDVKGLPDDGPEHPIWFEGRVQPLGFQVEGEDAVLWVASNITERHAAEEKLRILSETDALTGLWNRRHFDRTVAAEMERAGRYGHGVHLLIFDVDHFKVVNDTLGHSAGDVVLSEVARLLSNHTRQSDIVARWGGEEFSILMPHATDHAAFETAEKLRKAIEEFEFSHGCRMTVSVGVAKWGGLTESFDSLLARADDALYRVKGAGRNCVISAPVFGADSERLTGSVD